AARLVRVVCRSLRRAGASWADDGAEHGSAGGSRAAVEAGDESGGGVPQATRAEERLAGRHGRVAGGGRGGGGRAGEARDPAGGRVGGQESGVRPLTPASGLRPLASGLRPVV